MWLDGTKESVYRHFALLVFFHLHFSVHMLAYKHHTVTAYCFDAYTYPKFVLPFHAHPENSIVAIGFYLFVASGAFVAGVAVFQFKFCYQ